jgi:hypothetical protein
MQELAITRGVYTSTLAVFSDTHGRMVDETYHYDGPHLSEYDRTKWVAHYICISSFQPVSSVNFPCNSSSASIPGSPVNLTESLRVSW